MTSRHETAIEAALAEDWNQAHRLVQGMSDPMACWIHAIIHKIEGDASNSRYWYARTNGRCYEDFADAQAELRAVLESIRQG